MTLHLIGADRPHRLWLAICAGRWNFCFQFRRAASGTFAEVWRTIGHWVNVVALNREVGRELLLAVMLAPLLQSQLRATPDLLITCSDASHSGAGVVGRRARELKEHLATVLAGCADG